MEAEIETLGKGEQDFFFDWTAQNENFEHAFASVNPEWQVTYMNKAAKRLFRSQDSGDTTSFWEIFREIIPDELVQSRIKGNISELAEVLSQCWNKGDNSYRSTTYYSNQELSVHIRNLNAWQPAKSRVVLIKQLYHFISEISSECLWDWNLNSREIFWVDGGHNKILGYDIENAWIPESFWMNRIHPADVAKVKTKMTALFSNGLTHGELWDLQYRFQKADGEYCHVHDRGRIFFDEKNKPYRIFGATQNDTERFNSERQLEETKKQLALIVEKTVNTVIITAGDGTINYVNKAFTDCTGYELAEVYGQKPGAVLQGTDTNVQTRQYLSSRIENHLPFDCEILNYTKSGKPIWIHLQGQPFDSLATADQAYFSVQTDITERVLAKEKEISENEAHKIAITKAVLTALENERDEIGKEIHDNLNHTLVASKLYLELAKSDDSNRSVYLDKSLDYINSVIENIRRISKKLVTPELMGLISSINSLLDDLSLVYPIKFVLKTNLIEDELGEALKLNIFRIIQEQLTNIIKHSKAKQTTIRLSSADHFVNLSIIDNGIGFDTSIEPRGVGLRNIRSRAALFAGNVEIKSKPGKGFHLKVVMETEAF